MVLALTFNSWQDCSGFRNKKCTSYAVMRREPLKLLYAKGKRSFAHLSVGSVTTVICLPDFSSVLTAFFSPGYVRASVVVGQLNKPSTWRSSAKITMPRYWLRAQKLLTLTNNHSLIVRVLPGPPSPLCPWEKHRYCMSLVVSICWIKEFLLENKSATSQRYMRDLELSFYIEMPFSFSVFKTKS